MSQPTCCTEHPIADSTIGPLCKLHLEFALAASANLKIRLQREVDLSDDEEDESDG